MKRIPILLAAILIAALVTAGLATASVRHAKLQLRKTSSGKILVDRAGFTLYMFAKDHRNKDVCAGINGCLSVWPAFTTGGKPIAGPGIKSSLIGTINVPHVGKQVTYAGYPLYTYVADSMPGQTSYIGLSQFGAPWYALSGAGHLVKR
jgi:predicted lipoprotein with Yx(FWY)xxD motif